VEGLATREQCVCNYIKEDSKEFLIKVTSIGQSHRDNPCQISTQKSIPSWIWTKLVSYNSVYWDIDSLCVSAFYVVWLQS